MLPDNAAVEETFGWVCYRQGNYATAVEHLERSVHKHTTARRKYHLAMAYAKVGNRRRGLEILGEAFKMDPKLPEATMALQIFEEKKAAGQF
jgi:Tfp pilus assembly protein PilF